MRLRLFVYGTLIQGGLASRILAISILTQLERLGALLITSVFRLFTCGPVINFTREVWARLVGKELRYVHRILVAEHIAVTPEAFGLKIGRASCRERV